jgi:hypothetical protein
VATVDAGVNYLLPAIAEHLARDPQGQPLGFDFWDLDSKPFDANPARSPFFPQRHGTRTASLLLAEAPVVALVPYRYPRPEMGRMRALVADAAAKGVIIMNLSLGSRRVGEWQPFFEVAAEHPAMLFVVSAGNDGRDIDHHPVYPAAFSLPNLITVTSADDDGRPAAGSNWGARAVDLLVPAEHVLTTDFDGSPALVSGSSYAAVRVSALAACLLAENPSWRAPQLKAAIFAAIESSDGVRSGLVAQGYLPDPVARRRGRCAAQRPRVARLRSSRARVVAPTSGYELPITMAIVEDSGWMPVEVAAVAGRASEILAQCGVGLAVRSIEILGTPQRLQYFHRSIAVELVRQAGLPRPAVFFVKDTLDEPAFEAQTFARSNSGSMPALRDTLWMTRPVAHPGIALAHEIVHLLMDSGQHLALVDNLMQARTAPGNVKLTAAQCARMVQAAQTSGLLRSAS